jgi:hypothetical protein
MASRSAIVIAAILVCSGAIAVAVLIFSGVFAAAGAPPSAIEVHGLKFASPIAFSAPASAGIDALLLVHPADAKSGEEKMSLTAAAFPKDSGMSDGEILEYATTTFLATPASGKPVERTFLARKVAGQALEKKIPSPSLAEVYVVTKKNGDKVFLGFVFSPAFAKEAEKAIADAATTLKE